MAKTHKVTFKKSGITIDIAEDEYILEEAEDAGLHLPYDCRSGTCTTCIQKCLGGGNRSGHGLRYRRRRIGIRVCASSASAVPFSDVVLDA